MKKGMLGVLVFFITACALPEDIPLAVHQAVEEEFSETGFKVAGIFPCSYKDAPVFRVVMDNCADCFEPVYNKRGEKVCSLGGIAGQGDGKCPDFNFATCISSITACPADAKVCEDGSTIGRTGSDCTFPPCPSFTFCDATTPPCTEGRDCYRFDDNERAYCYLGNPCVFKCPSRKCEVMESYPLQIRCLP